MAHPVRRFVPAIGEAIETFRQQQATLIDPELMELCWRRIADVVDGTATDLPSNIGQRERACLHLAESFCYSAQSVTDEQVAEVLEHLPAQDVLALTTSLWVADASHRLTHFIESLGIAEEEP